MRSLIILYKFMYLIKWKKQYNDNGRTAMIMTLLSCIFIDNDRMTPFLLKVNILFSLLMFRSIKTQRLTTNGPSISARKMYENQSTSIESKLCVVTSGAFHGYQHEYFFTVVGVKLAFDERTIFEFTVILEYSLTNDCIFLRRCVFKPITDSHNLNLFT